jgi:hypothetical protein
VGLRAAIFGEPSIDGLAHQAALAPVDRIDENTVSGVPTADPTPDLDDLPGNVDADDQWQRDLDTRHPAAGEDIVIAE